MAAKDCFSPLVDWKNPEVIGFIMAEEFREAMAVTQCSRSKPVTVGSCAKLVLNRAKLKQHCRNGVEPAARKRMWLDVVGVNDADSVLLVKTYGEPQEDESPAKWTSMGLTTDLTEFPSYHLRLASYNPGLERVLCALQRKLLGEGEVDVHAPLIPVLASLMLHFIDEWEVFALLSHLLARVAWLDKNAVHTAASQQTLISLLRSHTPSTVDALWFVKPKSMTQQSFLEELTKLWFLWPFYQQPFWITVRVLDLYLVEGPKILYRLALSGLKLFSSLVQSLDPNMIRTAVPHLLSSMTAQQKKCWFHDALAIPHLSWSSILKKWHSHTTTFDSSVSEIDGASYDSSDSASGQEESVQVIPDPSSEVIKSSEIWFTLWTWLPEWVTCREPLCLFRASRDGYNLRTLYRKCDGCPWILLLIKSSTGRAFGSFIASELSERHNNQFFGTGETFLFSLVPEVSCYRWSAETDLILRANDHELIIGSGGGSYGLWLDSDLKGSSSTCLAFNNPPLSGAENQFICTCIEVYSCS